MTPFFFRKSRLTPGVRGMGSASIVRQAASTNSPFFSSERYQELAPVRVVVVSCDVKVLASIAELLQECSLKPEFASGLDELKSICSKSLPNVCLCGFQLADGSFRDVVEFLTERLSPIPVIMVSPPSADEASSCFLESIKSGALGTVCYPYRLN